MWKYLAAMGGLSLSMALTSCALSPQGQGADGSATVQRGTALRRDVEQEYARREESGALSAWRLGNDITAVAARHFPPGTTFDEGEAILRDAGFAVVSPCPPKASPPPADCRGSVSGSLRLAPSHVLGPVVDAVIWLEPPASANPALIGHVSGSIGTGAR